MVLQSREVEDMDKVGEMWAFNQIWISELVEVSYHYKSQISNTWKKNKKVNNITFESEANTFLPILNLR